ncbi:matrixin family metalloprotease [Sphingomonas sp. NBWT7]|uniref:M10 family metallopeptidase C-terminal domain-containing protein n=1 Tax=Sphingomonas sp. NBWT7 TaxID=2596913 RepID=UPI00162A3634|nr:M10 family metallopeptidase C-terminal domain-containing protein [Sphingomonas sp. NBWT7]QNE33148.1 matrixin family metalloprotease [Sphingomonas sp. NBWT7]
MSNVDAPTGAMCQCPACVGGSGTHPENTFWDDGRYVSYGSVDPDAGGSLNGKPIWTVDEVADNLVRTGQNWYVNNYGELNDGVLNYGFWKNYGELQNSYYFNATGTDYFAEGEKENFSAFNAGQKGIARDAMKLWDEVTSISFRETKSFDADITFGNTSTGGAQAYAYLPFGAGLDQAYKDQYDFSEVGRLGGDVWIDGFVSSNFNPLANSYYAVTTMIHEIGHAIGLSHPGDYNATDDNDGDGQPDPITYANDAKFAQDSRQYSIMSYFDAYETGAQHIDFTLTNFAYAATPLVHDIAAIQQVYGADTTTRTGNTVYGFNSTARNDAYDFTLNLRPIVTIWDAGGRDTLDFSGWDTPSIIDLNEGSFSSGGGVIEFPSLEEVNAKRAELGFAPRSQETYDFYVGLREELGLTNGLFTDNVSIAYGATIENAVGGGGNDLIIVNGVANRVDGGAGIDTVSYETATEGAIMSLQTGIGNVGALGDRLVNVENLIGSAFNDRLTGSVNDNTFEGGAGNDRLTGNGGVDTFVFKVANGSSGVDTITDFGRDDFIVTDKALADPNRDGVINVASNGVLVIDNATTSRVVLQGGLDLSAGLRLAGEENGLYYYRYNGAPTSAMPTVTDAFAAGRVYEAAPTLEELGFTAPTSPMAHDSAPLSGLDDARQAMGSVSAGAFAGPAAEFVDVETHLAFTPLKDFQLVDMLHVALV